MPDFKFGKIVPDYDVCKTAGDVGNVIIAGTCPVTGEDFKVEVDAQDYTSFKHGALIQNAFPYLSGEERDMILLGVTEEGHDRYLQGEPGDVEVDPHFSHTDKEFTLDDLPECNPS